MPSYNHYTPQSDGSYRRSTVPEGNGRRPNPRPPYQGQQSQPCPPQNPQPQRQEPPRKPDPPKQESCPAPQPNHCQDTGKQENPGSSGQGILSFLRGLLPRQIDAADLLVIALLLLINQGDECGEDDLSPLLTIALYFLL